MSSSSSQDAAQRELFRLLAEEDSKLADIESLIESDRAAGRIARAEAEMDLAGTRDAHLRACAELRRRYEAGELAADPSEEDPPMSMPAYIVDEPDEETAVILSMMETMTETQAWTALAYLAGDGHETQRALTGAVAWARENA